MNQFIASIFAAAIAFSTFSAISATMTENVGDASTGTSETTKIVEQNTHVDKGSAQNVTEGEYNKKSNLLKTKEKNAATSKANTTKANPVQPNRPEGATPTIK